MYYLKSGILRSASARQTGGFGRSEGRMRWESSAIGPKGQAARVATASNDARGIQYVWGPGVRRLS